jgi:adenylate cyclase
MALSLNPNYALAINARGLVHIYTGEPAKAIPYMSRRFASTQPSNCTGISWAQPISWRVTTRPRRLFKDRIAMTPSTDLSRAFLASALGHLGRSGGGPPDLARAQGDQSSILLCGSFRSTAV